MTPADSGPGSGRGRGRPPVGVKVQVRIPTDVLAQIDELAARRAEPRAATIRAIIDAGIEQLEQ